MPFGTIGTKEKMPSWHKEKVPSRQLSLCAILVQNFERQETFTGHFGGNPYYFTNKESYGRGNVNVDRTFEFKSPRTIRFWEPKGCDIRKIAVNL